MNLGSLVGYLGLDTREWDAGLDNAEGGLARFAKRGAVAAAAAGVAIAGAVTAAVVEGMNIEAANDKLAAQLGLSAEESKRVGGVAGKLYAGAYGENLGEVNDAVAAVMSSIGGMSTASSADLEAMTARVLNLSSAFGIDVARASQVAGQMISSGLAKDGAQALDLLTASMQKVPVAVREDLLDAIDEYGPFMSTLGITGEKAFGMLVKASEKGMYGIDKTGDALKEFGIRATDMSKLSGTAYDAIGMDQEEMTARLLAGGDTAATAFQEIVAGVQGIEDPVAKSQAALALFGTPLEDLSVTEIPTFLAGLTDASAGLGNVAGAADRMGQTLNDNASSNLESFKRQLIGAFVTVIGGQVLPMVNSVASTLATQFGPALAAVGGFLTGTLIPALQSTAQWMAANQTPIMIVAGLIAAVFIPHLIALGVQSLIAGAKSVAGWVMTQAGAVAGAAAHSLAVVKMVAGWVLMGVQSLIQAARMAAAWLIAMGPVGWVIAAVVGLVALIVANWDTVVAWTKKAWTWVVDAVKSAVSFMVSLFLNFTLVGLIIKHWDTIRSAFSSGVSAAVNFVRELPGKAYAALGNLGGLLVSAGGDLIRGFINGIKNMAGNLADAAIGAAKSAVNGIKNFLGIHSPSRVFVGIGENVGQGFINGMAAMQPAVAEQMMKLADNSALTNLLQAEDGSMVAASFYNKRPAGAPRTLVNGKSLDEVLEETRRNKEARENAALVHVGTVNLIEGTPQDVAQELAYLGRTRGW